MPTAFSILPDRFADGRHTAIETGLKACGYKIARGAGPGGADDVLVTWTVHRGYKERAARKFEAAGGRVIVCEEAYFRRIGGAPYFALALHDHNGAGRWPEGGPQRWDGFGIGLKPWRQRGHHILVREQRGIGSEHMASPPNWHQAMANRLRAVTDRPIVLRWHPKSRAEPRKALEQPPLEAALKDCWSVVTWASAIAGPALPSTLRNVRRSTTSISDDVPCFTAPSPTAVGRARRPSRCDAARLSTMPNVAAGLETRR
ncbi:MAG: hypothetical protein IIA44_04005 [Acidobacteria bacterium]|nr:hypothetical protein [Acidobacteriota bacterium]